MKIKKDKNYEILETEVLTFKSLIEKNIIEHLLNVGVLDEDEACFGITVKQAAFDYDANIDELFFKSLGHSNYTTKAIEAFKNLVVLGENDCPECGGVVEDLYSCGKVYRHDYDSEPYVDGQVEYKRCTNCKLEF
ncbi:MAG: hypothetical protein HQ522_16210 [Bacteroidetes bacterium]|nr:hypothetical protein [Bacteroidota bacterium]